MSSSIYYAVELYMTQKYFQPESNLIKVIIPMWWTAMLLVTYFMRRVLTEFFVMQSKAEKTRDALT